MSLTDLRFALPRPLVALYAALCLALSLGLVAMSQRRGAAELAWWLAVYLAVGLYSLRRPSAGPLFAGFAAFVLGFARTWRHGPNLDLGTSLVLLALSVYLFRLSRKQGGGAATDLGGLLLALVSTWSVLSLAVVVVRLRSFVPAPGFAHHVYRLNPAGLSSEEAITRAILNAAVTFAWFGAYEYARRVELPRRFALAVLGVLLVNSAALVVQSRLAPHFLHPADWPFFDRWNGVTSFCYALGDAALAFYLLLPAWWSGRRWPVGAAILLLLGHAVLASGSRMAMVGMVATAVLWTALRVLRLARAGRALPAAALSAAVALLLASIALVYLRTPADASTPIGRLKEGVERQGWVGHLVATRLNSYPLLFRLLREYPLSGIGAGLYPGELEKQRALLTPQLRGLDPFLLTSYAPNQLLNTGVELGLPAMLALGGALLLAGAAGLSRGASHGAAELGAGVAGLLLALQLGPGLYNSEALVFQWLIVGLAARGGLARPAVEPDGRRTSAAVTAACVLGALLLGLAGQALSWPELAVERQWSRLRWRMNIALQPPQANGQWTGDEATFSVGVNAPSVRIRWHAGDPAAHSYRAFVSFYVDGQLVERSLALPGRVRESVLPLPQVPGFKRISVRVEPPFVPARALGGDDTRALGVFLHSVTPEPAPPGAAGG